MEARRRLWLIGGTQESRHLVTALLANLPDRAEGQPSPLLISMTTDNARALYPDALADDLWIGQLTPDHGDRWIQQYNIAAILDASHPFATAISKLAIALAQRHQLPYLRYERPPVSHPALTWRDRQGRPGNITLPTVADVLTGAYLAQERTLLTLGYRALAAFVPWQSHGTLYVRILPSVPALTAALAAGFTSDRIIALRPPISDACEKALWQQWQLTQVITKASGAAGGEARKQAIAADLGIRLIRIARPAITYPAHTHTLATALQFAIQQCQG